MDDITILIRTWNRPEMLDSALQSVAEQDYRVVVAVDPRAKQGIYDMLERRSVEVARCKRQGLGAAWNEGMAHIDTGYVYVLDDDDTLLPDAASIMRRFIESQPEARTSLISFPPMIRDSSANPPRPTPRTVPRDFNQRPLDERYRLLLSDRGPRGNYLYHIDAFGMVGPVPEDMPVYEDYALALRSGGRLLYGDDPVLIYRVHDYNATGPGTRTWRQAAAIRVSLELQHVTRRQIMLASWSLPRRRRSVGLALYRMFGRTQ